MYSDIFAKFIKQKAKNIGPHDTRVRANPSEGDHDKIKMI